MAFFKTIEEIKEHVEASLLLNFVDLLPSIKTAEQKYLAPLLGQTLYASLTAEYNSNSNLGNLTTPSANLFNKLRPVIANYALALALPRLSVQVSSSGVHINSSETRKTAFAWQVKDAQQSYMASGDLYSDSMLQYLEETQASFPTWVASTGFTEYVSSILYTTKMFDEHVNIAASRVVFLRMKAKLRIIQQFQLTNTIGLNYVSELMTAIRAGTVSADDQIVLDLARAAMAYLAASEGLIEGLFIFDSDGATVINNRNTDVVSAKESAKGATVSPVAQKWFNTGLALLEKLRIYLNENATASRYITYFNSDLYVDPTTATGGFTNDPDSKVGYF